MTRGKMAADVQLRADDENLVTANTRGLRKLVTATNHILILGSCEAAPTSGCLQPIFPATITARCVFQEEEGLRVLKGA